MDATFNLLSCPWIAATDGRGAIRSYSIIDVIKNSTELREIVDPYPPAQFGVYRMLATFVADVMATTDSRDFEDVTVTQYAKEWEDRFDLFDPDRPFFQSPEQGKKLQPASVIFRDLPHGTNRMFFSHSLPRAFSPAACARALCAIPPFTTSGGAGMIPSINGVPPWYFWVVGQNVRETLLLNALAILSTENPGNEPPVWRSEDVASSREIHAASTMRGLTWQPRVIRLVPSDGGLCEYTGETCDTLVRKTVYDSGWSWAKNNRGTWRDPNVAYRVKQKKGESSPFADKDTDAICPRKDEVARQFPDMVAWQEAGWVIAARQPGIFPARGKYSFVPPAVIEELDRTPGINWSTISVEAYGIRTDAKDKLCDCKVEQLPVQPVSPASAEATRVTFQIVDATESAIRKAISGNNGKQPSPAGDWMYQTARRDFWRAIRVAFLAGNLRPDTELIGEIGRNAITGITTGHTGTIARHAAIAMSRYNDAINYLKAGDTQK